MFTNSNFIFNNCKINLLFVNTSKLKVNKLVTKCLGSYTCCDQVIAKHFFVTCKTSLS